MQIVAAAIAVDIQHLAAGIEARGEGTFHCLAVKLAGQHAAGSYLGAVHPQRFGDFRIKTLDHVGQVLQRNIIQAGNGVVKADAGSFAQHTTQTVMDNTCEQIAAGKLSVPLGGKQLHDFFVAILGEKIDLCFPAALLPTHIPGYFKDHRAGEAILGKLQFPGASAEQFAVMQDINGAVAPYALQSDTAIPGGFQLNKSRAEVVRLVAQLIQQPVAGQTAAQLCTGQTAAGHDQPVAEVFFFLGLQAELLADLADLCDLAAQNRLDIFPLQSKAQAVYYRVCLVRVGVYPAAIFVDSKKPQTFKPVKDLFRGIGFQHTLGKSSIISVEMPNRCMNICKIAAPVSRGQQFAAQPGLALEKENLVIFVLGSSPGSSHAAGAAADNTDDHIRSSQLMNIFYSLYCKTANDTRKIFFANQKTHGIIPPVRNMDRSNIDKIAHNGDDKLLLAKLWDKITAGMRKNIIASTGFLSPREQEMARFLFGEQEGLRFFGGYEDAERKMLIYLPDYLDKDALTDTDSPIACLRCTFHQGDSPSHRDFLGALMGEGISRDTLGDICVGQGSCDFFVTREIAPYILQNFTGAGRTKVHLKEIAITEAEIPEPETKEIRDTLASLRLDCVISSGFRIGRSLACQYIAAGKAAVDGLPCEKPDKTVSAEAKISVRGLGKVRLTSVNGETKKGRISVTIHKYI